MKKFISVVLIIMLLFSFSACEGKNEIIAPDEETIGSESDIKTEAEPEQTEESHIKTESGKRKAFRNYTPHGSNFSGKRKRF